MRCSPPGAATLNRVNPGHPSRSRCRGRPTATARLTPRDGERWPSERIHPRLISACAGNRRPGRAAVSFFEGTASAFISLRSALVLRRAAWMAASLREKHLPASSSRCRDPVRWSSSASRRCPAWRCLTSLLEDAAIFAASLLKPSYTSISKPRRRSSVDGTWRCARVGIAGDPAGARVSAGIPHLASLPAGAAAL